MAGSSNATRRPLGTGHRRFSKRVADGTSPAFAASTSTATISPMSLEASRSASAVARLRTPRGRPGLPGLKRPSDFCSDVAVSSVISVTVIVWVVIRETPTARALRAREGAVAVEIREVERHAEFRSDVLVAPVIENDGNF
jgi:hypothetical protein